MTEQPEAQQVTKVISGQAVASSSTCSCFQSRVTVVTTLKHLCVRLHPCFVLLHLSYTVCVIIIGVCVGLQSVGFEMVMHFRSFYAITM